MTKAAILAGGQGTRMGGGGTLPKPLTPIGGRPIIEHLMAYLAGHGIRDFVVAIGYAADRIEDHFAEADLPWNVELIDTGLDTATGGRVRRLAPRVGSAPFILTWCDGLYDADIGSLLAFHRAQGCLATAAAVHPPSRFGVLDLDGDRVVAMREKPPLTEIWINAGLFVLDPAAIGYVADDATSWEADVMPALASAGQLAAWRHTGFWQCMDTAADAASLDELWRSGPVPWRQAE
jgi:glucose-1-phosphate cytidylyltransferase